MPGRLVAIYTTASGGEPMVAQTACRAVAGAGLETDRYATKRGTFSQREGRGRHVTLIAREAIAAANDEGVEVGEHETRRNLVTEGVDLGALVGTAFTVGEVTLIGVRDCPPCAHLERLTRPASGPCSQAGAACEPMWSSAARCAWATQSRSSGHPARRMPA